MYHSDEIIRQLQNNKILALQVDRAVTGVRDVVLEQLTTIGAGATRLSYYASCFTEEYLDVCKKQHLEDTRFTKGILRLIKDRNIIYEMMRLYYELIFKDHTTQKLERIKSQLMQANIHITASSLTRKAFVLGVTASVVSSMNVSMLSRNRAGKTTSGIIFGLSIYGTVQKAADCAQRLHYAQPEYYQLLYAHELEMMFFIIEPVFIKAGALL